MVQTQRYRIQVSSLEYTADRLTDYYNLWRHGALRVN